MLNRPLEDILWENFGALEKTLQSNGYRTCKYFSNGFVVYEVRKLDPTLPLNGKYIAVRKSAGSDSLESAILLDAPSLPDASSVIMDLPKANKSVKEPAPHWLKEALYAGGAGLAGAGIAMTLAQDSSAAVFGFLGGAILYSMFPSAMKAFYSYLVQANSWHSNRKRVYAPSNGFKDAIEGKEAIVALLYLTEIHSTRG